MIIRSDIIDSEVLYKTSKLMICVRAERVVTTSTDSLRRERRGCNEHPRTERGCSRWLVCGMMPCSVRSNWASSMSSRSEGRLAGDEQARRGAPVGGTRSLVVNPPVWSVLSRTEGVAGCREMRRDTRIPLIRGTRMDARFGGECLASVVTLSGRDGPVARFFPAYAGWNFRSHFAQAFRLLLLWLDWIWQR